MDKSLSPTSSSLKDHIQAGHELIPLHAHEATDGKGMRVGKRPLHAKWNVRPALSPEEAKDYMEAGGNIGIRLRATDLVIDVDPRNFGEDKTSLDRFKEDFCLPDSPFVQTGGGGFHFYMRKAANIQVINALAKYPGIEFKSAGRQVVAAGSVHPDTKLLYKLDDDVLALTFADAPFVPNSLIKEITRESKSSCIDAGIHTPEELELMLDALDAVDFSDHERWFRLMMACHHATGGAGRDVFLAWCSTDSEYAGREDENGLRWDSLKNEKENKVTVLFLYKQLHLTGKGSIIEQIQRATPQEDFDDGLEFPQSEADATLHAMNEKYFTVLHGGKYLVGHETINLMLGHKEVEWNLDTAFRKHVNISRVNLGNESKPLGAWWLSHPKHRQYDGVVFDPTPGRFHERHYNLWQGWAVEPMRGDWPRMKHAYQGCFMWWQ